MDAQVLM